MTPGALQGEKSGYSSVGRASTEVISGTSMRMMRSMPCFRVIMDIAQPPQAPTSLSVTTPCGEISTISASPPAARNSRFSVERASVQDVGAGQALVPVGPAGPGVQRSLATVGAFHAGHHVRVRFFHPVEIGGTVPLDGYFPRGNTPRMAMNRL